MSREFRKVKESAAKKLKKPANHKKAVEAAVGALVKCAPKKKITPEQRKAVYCVMHGHSRIVETFFGYVHCARCGAQIGDLLAGAFNASDCVIVGHACGLCKRNFAKLGKTDKALVDKKVLKELE